jgi:bifunctional non-homologous end joining protein LigD
VKKIKTLAFVRPEMVAQIVYCGWTDDGKRRHASFNGLRDAADHLHIYSLTTS